MTETEINDTRNSETGSTETPSPAPVVTADGYICDPLTGEVFGHVDIKEHDAPGAAQKEPFIPDTMEKVKWVLRKIMAEDSAIAAAEMELQAISANIAAMKRVHEQKRNWQLAQFTLPLQVFAAEQLKGQKTRTLLTPYGTLSFRTIPGSLKIVDAPAALEWAEENAPNAVKTVKSVKISEITASDTLPQCFEMTERRDAFYIKTGM